MPELAEMFIAWPLSWNVTKWSLFSSIVPIGHPKYIALVLQHWNLIGQKSHQQRLWYRYKNVLASENFKHLLSYYNIFLLGNE